jgi:polysaccharide export outer membrane protein
LHPFQLVACFNASYIIFLLVQSDQLTIVSFRVFDTLKRNACIWRNPLAHLSRVGTVAAALLLAGCTALGGDGPATKRVISAEGQALLASQIEVVDLDTAAAERLQSASALPLFSETLGEVPATGSLIGPGDVLEVSITEAPPAVLFGGASGDSALRNPAAASNVQSVSSSRGWTSPQQAVEIEGTIFVPFAGAIPVTGRSPRQIEQAITERLRNKAHQPQVIVRRVGNSTATVTVLGEVTQSGRVPISAHGERLLEIIAAAGGPKHPLAKTLVQISRNQQVYTLPMAMITQDPRQNIVLRPNDVISLLFQPYTFTALGATGRSDEIPFEGPGFSLANALGRIGGLDENRADPKGVFIFRFEDPVMLDAARIAGKPRTADGKVPVIYRVDLRSPANLFLIQRFPVKQNDLVFVSNAPLVDFTKFLGIITSTMFSVAGVVNLAQ